MFADRFLQVVEANSYGICVKAVNKNRFTPVCFNFSKEVIRLPSTSLIDIPVTFDRKITRSQIDLLFIELIRSCRASETIDVLSDDPKIWKGTFATSVKELQKQIGQETKKLAVIGNGLDKFSNIMEEMLPQFEYMEVFEHKALKSDIVIMPLDVPCGTIVKLGKRPSRISVMVYENCVRRISFHNDDQLKKWLQMCSQEEKEPNGDSN